MIAFKNPDDALRLAYELQYVFYECTDFPEVIDRAYVSFDREKQAIEAIPNLSCDLPEDVYDKLWHGLRVRVGIHTDFGSILKDPVTKAFDYYGNVTNTAARVESVSHGGQVCFTEGTYAALEEVHLDVSSAETTPSSEQYRITRDNGPAIALKMGPKELRGLSDHVVMYQLECMAGRLYPPLRLEMAEDAEEEEYESSRGTKLSSKTVTAMTDDTASIASERRSLHSSNPVESAAGDLRTGFVGEVSSLHIMLAVYSIFTRIPQPEKRLKEYRKMCELWGIKVDKKAIERVKLWNTLKGTSEGNSNRLIALHLAKDDHPAAAHLEVLSRRVRNIVSKNLQNAIVATHGVGALRQPTQTPGHPSIQATSPSLYGAYGGDGMVNDNGTVTINLAGPRGFTKRSSATFIPPVPGPPTATHSRLTTVGSSHTLEDGVVSYNSDAAGKLSTKGNTVVILTGEPSHDGDRSPNTDLSPRNHHSRSHSET